MQYVIEFYPVAGLHPEVSDEDLLFQCKARTPFPTLEVGDTARLLTTSFPVRQTIGSDFWIVKKREFIFWDNGSTTMYWCEPPKKAGSRGK